ncbi:MAG: cytochrome c oxidase subunit CcoP [Flavipsychrobacter sp.]|jgi:cytochrome c oxidase cbb3-type subunit 3|nr:cytochrome c oxidase subunit CcoP [Flavipsychrobacter sp.]
MQIKKKIILSAVATLIPGAMCFAATQAADKSEEYNWALLTLVGLMITLVFIIGVLAGIMKQLGHVVREKMRKEKNSSGTLKAILILVSLTFIGVAAQAAEAEVKPTVEVQYLTGVSNVDFYLIIGVIALELVTVFMLAVNILVLLKTLKQTDEPAVEKTSKWSNFWDKFHAATALEKEKEILLDHNYDGIQELDNSLPPWWKYGFYLTIIVGVIYIYRYHVSHDGPSQTEEFAMEMQQGEEDKAAYLAKTAGNIDENSVVIDANDIAPGKEIYVKVCAACHLADGGGAVGPNLADEYWLHGGGIKDIFKSIKYGWQDKGMKSWKDDYSPKQLQQLANFVVSLKGTHPATPKASQGDLYIEAIAPNPGLDSIKKDSVKTVAAVIK